MKPKEVPAEFVEIAVEVFEDQAHEHCNEDGCPGQTRPYHEALVRESLAEILPLHEERIRTERDATALVITELQALRDSLYGQLEAAGTERDALRAAVEQVEADAVEQQQKTGVTKDPWCLGVYAQASRTRRILRTVLDDPESPTAAPSVSTRGAEAHGEAGEAQEGS